MGKSSTCWLHVPAMFDYRRVYSMIKIAGVGVCVCCFEQYWWPWQSHLGYQLWHPESLFCLGRCCCWIHLRWQSHQTKKILICGIASSQLKKASLVEKKEKIYFLPIKHMNSWISKTAMFIYQSLTMVFLPVPPTQPLLGKPFLGRQEPGLAGGWRLVVTTSTGPPPIQYPLVYHQNLGVSCKFPL